MKAKGVQTCNQNSTDMKLTELTKGKHRVHEM